MHLVFAFGGEDEQCRAEVGVPDRAAKNDYAFCDKAVDERNVLAPPVLLSARPRRIPVWARELSNEEVIQPAPPSRFRILSDKPGIACHGALATLAPRAVPRIRGTPPRAPSGLTPEPSGIQHTATTKR